MPVIDTMGEYWSYIPMFRQLSTLRRERPPGVTVERAAFGPDPHQYVLVLPGSACQAVRSVLCAWRGLAAGFARVFQVHWKSAGAHLGGLQILVIDQHAPRTQGMKRLSAIRL